MPAMFIPAVPAAVAGKLSAGQLLAHLAPSVASLIQGASAARATPAAGSRVLMPSKPIPMASRAAPVNTSLLMGNAGLWNRPTQNVATTEARLAQAFQQAQAQKQAQTAMLAQNLRLFGASGNPAPGSGTPLVRFPGIIDVAGPPITRDIPGGASFTCKDGSRTPNPTTCPEWQAAHPSGDTSWQWGEAKLPPADGQGVVCADGSIASSASGCPGVAQPTQVSGTTAAVIVIGALALVAAIGVAAVAIPAYGVYKLAEGAD